MAPQVGQQPSARDWIPLLICKNFVELRGFEPLTPSMPWRCATSCATAPRGLGTDEPGPKRPDIGEPYQHRGEILPCRADDFDLTRLLDGNRAQAGADGLFLQFAEAVRARDAANETPTKHLKRARRSRVQEIRPTSA